MGSFGERLRREREMRGITIEEIAEATKIGSRNLRALEEENFNLLPGGIFNKGFVRAYARYLGLDEEQAVADYIAAESSFRDGSTDSPDEPVERSSGGGKGLAVILVLLLVIGGGGFGGWQYYQKRKAQHRPENIAAPQPPAAQPAAAPPAPVVTPASQPATTTTPDASSPAPTTTADASAPAPAAPAAADATSANGFVVELKAIKDSWVSAKADGKSVLSGTLKATDGKTLRAHERLVLTLGNAGGVQVSYNGKDLNLGNAAGQVKTLVFTAQGLQPDAPEQR